MIAVLSGGVGAARFLEGLVQVVDPQEIVAIVNTGDDLEWNGLHVSPDLDTVTYTLAGANATTGWGLEGETWNSIDALARYGRPTWFQIGDKDLATHLFRTQLLTSGALLDEVTRMVAKAWNIKIAVVPMSNDSVRTMLTIETGEEIDFQEYFVHQHHDVAVRSLRFAGIEDAHPAPDVLPVLEEAEAIIIAPSNPIVSIGPILAFPEIAEVLARRRDHVVAISPIVGGRALKGPADRLLAELGYGSNVVGAASTITSYCSTFVIDEQDRDYRQAIDDLGLTCVVTETVMTDLHASAQLAATTCRALGIDIHATLAGEPI